MNTSMQVLLGGTRLVFDSVEDITNVVEQVHQAISQSSQRKAPLIPKAREVSRTKASAVYATIRGVNGALRAGADWRFGPSLHRRNIAGASAPEIRVMSAINAVIGDHLEDTGNPLAATMTLLAQGQPLDFDRDALKVSLTQASPHLVVLVHGFSLSELSWQRDKEHSVGQRLEEELGCTPVYLRYNSGRHISTNGQEFDQMLKQLCEAWPVPVKSLSLIGHSMGGLIIRSACWYAAQANSNWMSHLQRVVFLGTPHHGAPLAKASHALRVAAQKIPYAAPLGSGGLRSDGAMDLRHGDLLDEDWQGHDPNQPRPDTRQVVPLLPEVDYYFAAATLGKNRLDPMGQILGDLLVGVNSALGFHENDFRKLDAKPENCRVFHKKNHFDLLDDEIVHQQIIDWFSAS